MSYVKPSLQTLSLAIETSGCCFFVNSTGEGFFFYPDAATGALQQQLNAIVSQPGGDIRPPQPEVKPPEGSVATVGGPQGADGTPNQSIATVTPLCGTGLPATQPIIFGVPVGVSGVQATAGTSGVETAIGQPAVTVGGAGASFLPQIL